MKKISLLFVLLVLFSCFFSTAVHGKGEIGDNDAFSAYYGKTKSEVRKIAPSFEEWGDGFYIIDAIIDEEDLLGLLVKFDDHNVVDGVVVLVTSGILGALDLDNDLVGAATLGLITLGFEADDIRRTSTDEENFDLTLKNGVYIRTTEMSKDSYMILALKS